MSEIGILSSGDPEKDRFELEKAKTYHERIDQGICANGCAFMIWETAHTAKCPECSFLYSTNLPYGKREKDYENNIF
jgi:hypothetical protein